jgi:hypothetical protein
LATRIVVMKLPLTTCPQLRPFSSYFIIQPAKNFDILFRCAVRSPPTCCQVTSWPRDRFSRYSKLAGVPGVARDEEWRNAIAFYP